MERRNRTKWIVRAVVAGGAVVLLYLLVHGSMMQRQYSYLVCVDFGGGSHCATATGMTADEAIRSAQEIDCSALADSRTSNMVCLAKAPSSTKKLEGADNGGGAMGGKSY